MVAPSTWMRPVLKSSFRKPAVPRPSSNGETMFSDPNTALMALVILNFAGTLLMFLFVLRSQDNTQKLLLEQYSQMQLRLVDLEQRIAELGFPAQGATPAPKLFSDEDDLAAMLEGHAAKMQPQPFAGASGQAAPRPGGGRPAQGSSPLPDFFSMDGALGQKKKNAPASHSAASPLDIKLG